MFKLTLNVGCHVLICACKYHRVVVTGMGVVSPLGVGVPYVWPRLIDGCIGTTSTIGPEYEQLPCKVAAFVPKGEDTGQLNLSKIFRKSDLKNYSMRTLYGLVATEEALNDANWFPESKYEQETTGVSVGTGMVDLNDIIDEGTKFIKNGYTKVSPYFISKILTNLTAGQISMKYGFKGPNHSVSTACATGGHAIGDSYNLIKLGYTSVMLCGATEAVISPLSLAAFSRIRALSTNFNDIPSKASRPFDKGHDGFVMGEGAGILVLESLEHALKRNAKIYAEVLGYGLSGDAHQITAPSPDGRGAFLSMNSAVKYSSIEVSDISYVNAHATSTPVGDSCELRAVEEFLGNHSENVFISSTKGSTGHLLGAAGSVEAIFTILACNSGQIPPTVNFIESDCNTKLQIVANKSISWCGTPEGKRVALKNSFGFGGTNASLVFSNFYE